MNESKVSRFVLIIVAVVFAAALSIIAVVFLVIRSASERTPDISGFREPKSAQQAVISANPGGKLPTSIPLPTPTPLEGMNSPVFCKLELTMLNSKAREFGWNGMMTLEKYDQSAKSCSFLLREFSAVSHAGQINVIHEEGGDYGVQVEIPQRAGARMDEKLILWGTVALTTLDKSITQEEAEAAVRSAVVEGTAACHVYDITLKQKPFDTSSLLSIMDRTKKQEN